MRVLVLSYAPADILYTLLINLIGVHQRQQKVSSTSDNKDLLQIRYDFLKKIDDLHGNFLMWTRLISVFQRITTQPTQRRKVSLRIFLAQNSMTVDDTSISARAFPLFHVRIRGTSIFV